MWNDDAKEKKLNKEFLKGVSHYLFHKTFGKY
jgi:hypothetical protein